VDRRAARGVRLPDGTRRPGRIAVGRPYVVDKKQSSCPIVLDGLHPGHPIHGGDPMQALLLALRFAGNLLHTFLEQGGRVVDEDDDDVPLDAYFGPLVRAPGSLGPRFAKTSRNPRSARSITTGMKLILVASISMLGACGGGKGGLFAADANPAGDGDAPGGHPAADAVVHQPGDPRMVYVGDFGAIISALTDGSDARVISPDGWLCQTPAWSPDGQHLVFAASPIGEEELFVMDAGGSAPRRLFDWSIHQFDNTRFPTWSKNGVIAFEVDNDYSSGPVSSIYEVDWGGGDPTPQQGEGDSAGAPAWSPDGTQLAFGDGGPIGPNRLLAWLNPVTVHFLSNYMAGVIFPVWSPDGNELFFTRSEPDISDFGIYRVGADGMGLAQLATPTRSPARPSVSRDGKTIAYGAYDRTTGASEIDTLDVATGAIARLVYGASDPAYQP
jgi:hypothetical protein